jgi:hypothetical protein
MSSIISQTLHTKASKARTRLAHKNKMNKECDYQRIIHRTTFNVMSAINYLRAFMSEKTIDTPVVFTKVEMYARKVHADEYVYVNEKDDVYPLDASWIEKQNEYITSLQKEQLFNLYGYTFKGDELVNKYIRGDLDVDDFTDYLQRFIWHDIHYHPLFFPALHVFERYPLNATNILFTHKLSSTDREHIAVLTDPKQLLSQRYKSYSKLANKLSFDRFWVSAL